MSPEKKANIDRRIRLSGKDEIRRFLALARTAFPDLKFSLEQRVTDEKGEAVAYVWSATGTHTGEVEGFAATGAKATLRGVSSVDRIATERNALVSPRKKANIDRRIRLSGKDEIRRFLALARTAFPDLKFSLEQRVTDEKGEAVAYVWSATGTHTGEVEGFAATGETATLRGVSSVGKTASQAEKREPEPES